MGVKSEASVPSRIVINLFLIILCIACVLPLWSIISISLSTESDILENGYKLIPEHLSLQGYEFIFKNPKSILNGYKVTTFVTVVGSVLGLLVSAMIAYPLSRPDFAYRKGVSFFLTFTMLFNGGMIPTYLVMTELLHLRDSIWALILPYLANVWHIFLLRTFFSTIPFSLVEAAKIDGASEFRIFWSIIVPLAKTGLVTVLLFYVLIYWNDWYLSLLYIVSEDKLSLQYLLSRMMNNLDFISKNMGVMPAGVSVKDLPKEATRMAMCIVAAGPMLFAFPFFQRYFVKGITIGSVKE